MSCAKNRHNRAGIPRIIFQQIQRLTQLRDLRLCFVKLTWEDSGTPEIYRIIDGWAIQNVKDALKAFSGLKDLETLELKNLAQYLERGTINEAKKHWTKLKWLHCNVCYD